MHPLHEMDRTGIKNYIIELQNIVKSNLSDGNSIDDFLDKTTIFDEIEKILPDEEFGIFVLTILNGFESDIIYDNLIDSIQLSISKEEKNENL